MKKLFSTRFTNGAVNFSLLLLRVIFGGLLFVNYGLAKVKGFNGDKKYGFPDPFHIGHVVSYSLVTFAESVCAILLVLGLFTRLAAIPVVITMGVVVFMVKAHASLGDNEVAVMFLSASLILLVTGPGRASLDSLIGK